MRPVEVKVAVITLDRALGLLAGWGIAKTPKKFKWEIRSVILRPSPRRLLLSRAAQC